MQHRGVRALIAAGATLLVGCPPSESAHVRKAQEAVERGCCSVSESPGGGDFGCSTCPLLQDAKIVETKAHDDCANSCQMVEMQTRGPNGDGQCTMMVSWYNDAWHLQGACHPR